MSYNKMLAFSLSDLKKLIDLVRKISHKSKEDFSEKIIENIQNLDTLNVNDFIKENKPQNLYTKKSPVNYRWIIPND